MRTINDIISRNSNSKLKEPHPTDQEMHLVYKAALRAADHANLKPTQFIEIKGKGLDKLSSIFQKYAKETISPLSSEKLIKYKNAPYRAPMIIMAISKTIAHKKVPDIEQMLSTGAAVQNMLNAIHSIGFSAIWRTGIFALNDSIGKYFDLDVNQKILGYIYVGTAAAEPKKIKEIDLSKHVKKWH